MRSSSDDFDWGRLFYNNNPQFEFIGEIAIRTTIMFLILIFALKLLSKRGVKQLSVFELAILIALGSATGDPMFYKEIAIIYGFSVILVVILLYKGITFLTARSKTVEEILEGKPICLVENGRIVYKNYKKIGLPYDKFFAELRLKSIDHLGQVRKAYLETSGEISVYFYEDKNVMPGLPIYPELFENAVEKTKAEKKCACINCGNVQLIHFGKNECTVCDNIKWIDIMERTRVR